MKANSSRIFSEIKFMVILGTVCAVLLMGARVTVGERAELTTGTINAVFALTGQETIAESSAALNAFNQKFSRRVTGRYRWWQSLSRPELWVCEARGAGMWAEINLVFVLNKAQHKIMGMRVVEQNETAGLGDRIADEDFYEQFDDLEARSGIEMAAARSRGNQFDAISGATITSRAVETMINRALKNLQQSGISAPVGES